MKTVNKIITGLVFSTFCLASYASPIVTSWDFIVDTAFTSSTLTGGGTPVGSNMNTEWSAPTTLTWGDVNGAGATSSISVADGNNGNNMGVVMTDDAASVHTAKLEHQNNPISLDFETLAGATLKTRLQLAPLTPFIGGDVGLPSLEFDILFEETINSAGSCFAGSISVCDDIFVINLAGGGAIPSFNPITQLFSFTQIYSLNEYTYAAEIIVDGLKPLGSVCNEVGAPMTCIGFTTQEGLLNQFDVSLKVSLVPEPSVLLLMGLALLGIVGTMRNKHI